MSDGLEKKFFLNEFGNFQETPPPPSRYRQHAREIRSRADGAMSCKKSLLDVAQGLEEAASLLERSYALKSELQEVVRRARASLRASRTSAAITAEIKSQGEEDRTSSESAG